MWYDLGMKVLSLFDGISCARVALERAGHKVDAYFASEIDKYAIQISKKNYSDNNHIGSVVGLTMNESIDLLIGGSPCQDLSIAKKDRKGLDGERSGLFWEYVRILKEVKPKYFVLENVNSMPKEAKAIITKALGVEPIMINAALVSAQNRKRLFWTNIPNVTLPEDKGILLKDILEKGDFHGLYSDYNNSTTHEKARTLGTGCGVTRSATCQQVITKPVRIAKIGKGGQGDRVYSIEGKSVNLSANGGGRGAKTGLYAVKDFVRKLTPIECERLQGLPDNYTDGVSNTQRYKALGNAFNVDVVAHILSFIPKTTTFR
jgi:DNA (cytosine-5)-methyltransferase 3A